MLKKVCKYRQIPLEVSADFERFDRKTKREISQKVLAEIEAEYDFNQDVEAPQDIAVNILLKSCAIPPAR